MEWPGVELATNVFDNVVKDKLQNSLNIFLNIISIIARVFICVRDMSPFAVASGTAAGGRRRRVSNRKSGELPAEDDVNPVPELTTLLQELRYITRRMRSDAEKESEMNDWKFAAMVIDRLCFWIFSVYLVLLTAIILGLASS